MSLTSVNKAVTVVMKYQGKAKHRTLCSSQLTQMQQLRPFCQLLKTQQLRAWQQLSLEQVADKASAAASSSADC